MCMYIPELSTYFGLRFNKIILYNLIFSAFDFWQFHSIHQMPSPVIENTLYVACYSQEAHSDASWHDSLLYRRSQRDHVPLPGTFRHPEGRLSLPRRRQGLGGRPAVLAFVRVRCLPLQYRSIDSLMKGIHWLLYQMLVVSPSVLTRMSLVCDSYLLSAGTPNLWNSYSNYRTGYTDHGTGLVQV